MIQPLHSYVLIQPIGGERQLESGLIVERQTESFLRGEIVALGPRVKEVTVGMKVFYRDASEVDGLHMTDIRDVVGVFE